MSVTVTIKDDHRILDSIMREIGQMRGSKITVGIHGDDSARDDADTESNPQIGARHEYGIGVPERAFLRPVVQSGQVQSLAETALAEVALGNFTADVATQRIGVLTVAAVKERIQAGINPPLSPMTVAKRKAKGKHGSGLASLADATTPLVDTGQLIQSIQYRVDGVAA